MKAIKAKISGRVQGVAFRYYCKLQADELNIFGTVQNLNDGTVELKAQGNEHQIRLLLIWCKSGSPAAQVTQVETIDFPLFNPKDFSILR